MNSLKRTFHILELLADQPKGIPFNEMRRRCGDLAPTTLSRLLQAMVRDELLDKDRDTGNYVLGGGFLALARKALGVQSRAELVKPELDALAEATGESAVFFNLESDGMTLIAKTEKQDSYHYSKVGMHWGPLPNDPFGWACMADSDSATVPYDALTELRSDGAVAVRRNLRGQVLRVVAPVFLHGTQTVIGSVGVTAIVRAGLDEETAGLKNRVRATAQRLSERIIN